MVLIQTIIMTMAIIEPPTGSINQASLAPPALERMAKPFLFVRYSDGAPNSRKQVVAVVLPENLDLRRRVTDKKAVDKQQELDTPGNAHAHKGDDMELLGVLSVVLDEFLNRLHDEDEVDAAHNKAVHNVADYSYQRALMLANVCAHAFLLTGLKPRSSHGPFLLLCLASRPVRKPENQVGERVDWTSAMLYQIDSQIASIQLANSAIDIELIAAYS